MESPGPLKRLWGEDRQRPGSSRLNFWGKEQDKEPEKDVLAEWYES